MSSSQPPPAGRRGLRGSLVHHGGDLETGPTQEQRLEPGAGPTARRRVLVSMSQLGARDDGRAVLLLFVVLVIAQKTGLLHALVLGFILVSCTRLLLFCIALGAQLSQLEHEDAAAQRTLLNTVLTDTAASGQGLDPLLLQLRLLGRDIDPRDYAALLALDENEARRGRGLTAEQLSSLPRHTVVADTAVVTCAVCLEDAAVGETLCRLPCAHQYHCPCIERWLAASTVCPVCKQAVVHDGEQDTGTSGSER